MMCELFSTNGTMSFRKQNWTKEGLDVPVSQSDAAQMAPSVTTEVDLRKEIKYGNRIQAAYAIFSEFCLYSSVHGVRYFTERRRHWSERVWWIIAFILSLFLCVSFIKNVYAKWDQKPVIVSFAEKSTPVWAIPFPAVTICPETKTKMDLLNFTDVYHRMQDAKSPTFNMTDDKIERMQAIAQICDFPFTEGTNFTDNAIYKRIKEVALDIFDTMFFCQWRNKIKYCFELFKPLLTEEGICFTFNGLNSDEIYNQGMNTDLISFPYNLKNLRAMHWNLETGYNLSVPVDQTYPFRVFGAGARAGLTAEFRLNEKNFDYICRGPVQGFKILLHSPNEVPQVSKHYFRLPLLQEVIVSVKPNMITTSEGLRHYEANRRQCYFDSEKRLRFFKFYTQRNCELECLSDFTNKKCGCVKFSMPRDNETKICGVAKIKCYNDAEDSLLEKDFTEGLAYPMGAPKTGCNCLPACTSVTYDAEISQAKYDWISTLNAKKIPLDHFPGMQPARVSIYFKEHQFITTKRSELFGKTDFLANCGGLLGLFMGVSLLSIVEVIYYVTLRLGCQLLNRNTNKQKNRIAATELANVPCARPMRENSSKRTRNRLRLSGIQKHAQQQPRIPIYSNLI